MKALFLAGFLTAVAAGSAFADSFAAAAAQCPNLATTPCDETTTSLGQFIINISPAFRPYFVGVQGYDSTSGTLVSPLLFDANTVIGLSTPYTDGSRPANLTVGVTQNGVTAVTETGANAPTALPTGYPTGNDAISTAILNAALTGGGVTVNIGAAAAGTPVAGAANLGEVESQSCNSTTTPGCNDFPAQSFFDVFVDVSLPGLGTFSNTAPLVVSSTLPTPGTLPPHVVYTHGQSSSVGIFADTNEGPFVTGDQLGTFVLTGHGVAYNKTAVSEELFGGQLTDDVNADSALTPEEKTFIDNQIIADDGPEPSTVILLFSGAAGLLGWRRLRRRNETE